METHKAYVANVKKKVLFRIRICFYTSLFVCICLSFLPLGLHTPVPDSRDNALKRQNILRDFLAFHYGYWSSCYLPPTPIYFIKYGWGFVISRHPRHRRELQHSLLARFLHDLLSHLRFLGLMDKAPDFGSGVTGLSPATINTFYS